MKKFLALAISLFALSVSAQTLPVSIIVQGGYNGANLSTSGNASQDKSTLNSGFRVGAAVDYTFYSLPMIDLSVQLGANFATKGAVRSIGDLKNTINLNYIDIPLLVNARFDLGNGLGVYVNAGPYLGIGINGKGVSSLGKLGEVSKDINPFSGDKAVLNRFDYGAQVGAGVEFNRILVGIGTQFGLANLNKDSSSSIKNSGFYATVGYRF